MNFKEFQIESRKTALYPNLNLSIEYPLMGLMGEFGELSEKFKKVMRDNNGVMSSDRTDGIINELGDLMWYLFQIYSELKIDFKENYEELGVNGYTVDEKYLKSTTCLLGSMHCCISDIIVYCLSTNKVLLSLVTNPSNTLVIYIKHICKMCNITIEEVMNKNIEKLKSRLERNVVKGEGDNR